VFFFFLAFSLLLNWPLSFMLCKLRWQNTKWKYWLHEYILFYFLAYNDGESLVQFSWYVATWTLVVETRLQEKGQGFSNLMVILLQNTWASNSRVAWFSYMRFFHIVTLTHCMLSKHSIVQLGCFLDSCMHVGLYKVNT
jgi:hypothetical protein